MPVEPNDLIVNAIKPVDPNYLTYDTNNLFGSDNTYQLIKDFDPLTSVYSTTDTPSPYSTTDTYVKPPSTISSLWGILGDAVQSYFNPLTIPSNITATTQNLTNIRNNLTGSKSDTGGIVVTAPTNTTNWWDYTNTNFLDPNYLNNLLGTLGQFTAPDMTTEAITVGAGEEAPIDVIGKNRTILNTASLLPTMPDYLKQLYEYLGINTDEIVSTAQKPSVTVPGVTYPGTTVDTGLTSGDGEIVSTAQKPSITVPGVTYPGTTIDTGYWNFTGGSGSPAPSPTITDILSAITAAAKPTTTPYTGTQLRGPRKPNYTVTPYAGDYEKYGFGPAHNFYSPEYYGIVPGASEPTLI